MTPAKKCPDCQIPMLVDVVSGQWECVEFPYSMDASQFNDGKIGCGHTEPLAMDVAAALDPSQQRMEGF